MSGWRVSGCRSSRCRVSVYRLNGCRSSGFRVRVYRLSRRRMRIASTG
jgi:hypothetical protein